MTALPVFARALRLRSRSLLAWSIGTAAFVAMMVAIFPVVRDDETFDELLAEYPEPVVALMGGELALSTGPGFMSAELYSLMLPVLVAVLAANAAAALLAVEDERGWLSLVVSGPVTRRRVVCEVALAVAVIAAVPVVVAALVLVLGGPLVDLEMGFGPTVDVSVTTWAFGLLFGGTALAAAGAVGRRGAALGTATGFLLYAYAAEIVGSTASWGRTLQQASPFHHLIATQPAIRGLPALELLGAAVWVLALFALAVAAIERRDLIG